MSKGALALLIHGGTDNWSPERWKLRFDEVCHDRPVLPSPDGQWFVAAEGDGRLAVRDTRSGRVLVQA